MTTNSDRDDLIRRCMASGMDEAAAAEFADEMIQAEADRSEADKIHSRLMAEAAKALRTIRAGLGVEGQGGSTKSSRRGAST